MVKCPAPENPGGTSLGHYGERQSQPEAIQLYRSSFSSCAIELAIELKSIRISLSDPLQRQLLVLTPSGQALIVSQRGDRGQSHGTGGRPTHALVLLTACDAEIVGFFTAIAGITQVQGPA